MPEPSLPPLLRGLRAADPMAAAIAEARAGCDGGTLFWRAGDSLAVALVLAPEVARARAAQMLPLAAVAMRDALGAVGPPELPVHLAWDGAILVNGAEAGRVRGVAPAGDGVPDWLVVHVALRFLPGRAGPHGGTALWEEGCGEVTPDALLESWSRHLMHRLAEWEDDPRPLYREVAGAAWEAEARDPAWIGRDAAFGRLRRNGAAGDLRRDGAATILDPLDTLLEAP